MSSGASGSSGGRGVGELVGFLLFSLFLTAIGLILFHLAAALVQIVQRGWSSYARFNRWLRREERIP
jgi:hypothetical protein